MATEIISHGVGGASDEPHKQPAYRLVLSLTLEADYRNRGLFPGLRIEAAAKRAGTYLYFDVSVDFARAVLEDAEERYKQRSDMRRGLPAAYSALVRQLKVGLDRAEGVVADPGVEAWLAEQRKEFAQLAVGQHVQNGEAAPLTIVGPYTLRKVADPDGPFRSEQGRFSYRNGYAAKDLDGTECFYAAGDLYTEDGAPAHLRLVRSHGRAVCHVTKRCAI